MKKKLSEKQIKRRYFLASFLMTAGFTVILIGLSAILTGFLVSSDLGDSGLVTLFIGVFFFYTGFGVFFRLKKVLYKTL